MQFQDQILNKKNRLKNINRFIKSVACTINSPSVWQNTWQMNDRGSVSIYQTEQ